MYPTIYVLSKNKKKYSENFYFYKQNIFCVLHGRVSVMQCEYATLILNLVKHKVY